MAESKPAAWRDRFYAWLIDVLLVSLLWGMTLKVLGILPFSFSGLILLSAQTFFYWTALEGFRGQSLGKMIINLEVVGSSGEAIGFGDSAVESFGKAFLLPLDCLLGLVLMPKEGQRLFNRVSHTVVVYAAEDGMGCKSRI